MKPVDAIPLFDGRSWSSIRLTPRQTEAATLGERNGYVVIDNRHTARLGRFWFFWCEAVNRPAIVVVRRKRDRADVCLDLYCTDRCLTPAGWHACVDACGRHGGRETAKRHKYGLVSDLFVFEKVAWNDAEDLARELLAIVSSGSFVEVCYRRFKGARQ
jgi:hypothetical protein